MLHSRSRTTVCFPTFCAHTHTHTHARTHTHGSKSGGKSIILVGRDRGLKLADCDSFFPMSSVWCVSIGASNCSTGKTADVGTVALILFPNTVSFINHAIAPSVCLTRPCGTHTASTEQTASLIVCCKCVDIYQQIRLQLPGIRLCLLTHSLHIFLPDAWGKVIYFCLRTR